MTAKTYHQLNLFGDSKPNRIYVRDSSGRFSTHEMSVLEKLYRENNRLKLEAETWKRKAQALIRYKIMMDRANSPHPSEQKI